MIVKLLDKDEFYVPITFSFNIICLIISLYNLF
jgi:hypothetical protein